MITVLFGSYYLINSLTTPALEPITVFTADTTPQHIVLQKMTEKNCVRRTAVKQSSPA